MNIKTAVSMPDTLLADISAQDFNELMSLVIKEGMCSDSMLTYVQNIGATFVFEYFAEGGKQIGRIQFNCTS